MLHPHSNLPVWPTQLVKSYSYSIDPFWQECTRISLPALQLLGTYFHFLSTNLEDHCTLFYCAPFLVSFHLKVSKDYLLLSDGYSRLSAGSPATPSPSCSCNHFFSSSMDWIISFFNCTHRPTAILTKMLGLAWSIGRENFLLMCSLHLDVNASHAT